MLHKNLSKKKFYIIGGLGTIGKETCKLINSYNSKVIILDINFKKWKSIKKNFKSNKIKYENFDCADLKNLEINLKKIFLKHGTPNVLINTSYPTSNNWVKNDFDNINIDEFNENIDSNLVSYCWISKIFADHMKVKKVQGSIINIGSIYGILGQNENFYKNTNLKENFSYPIIKGALVNYTKQMASFYGKYGIRFNLVSPGGIKGNIRGSKNKQNNIFIKKYISEVPLKRMCKPSDIANACLFLGSDDSSYISGVNLVIDGAITAKI